MIGEPDPLEEAATGMGDIDFCLELLHSDIINVAYILELIADLNPYSEDYEERRKHIIDTMITDLFRKMWMMTVTISWLASKRLMVQATLKNG